jgi:hypothetical protein
MRLNRLFKKSSLHGVQASNHKCNQLNEDNAIHDNEQRSNRLPRAGVARNQTQPPRNANSRTHRKGSTCVASFGLFYFSSWSAKQHKTQKQFAPSATAFFWFDHGDRSSICSMIPCIIIFLFTDLSRKCLRRPLLVSTQKSGPGIRQMLTFTRVSLRMKSKTHSETCIQQVITLSIVAVSKLGSLLSRFFLLASLSCILLPPFFPSQPSWRWQIKRIKNTMPVNKFKIASLSKRLAST